MAEQRRAPRPDDVYALKQLSDPRLSPDGTRVAYVVGWCDRDSDEYTTTIWTARLDGRSAPRPFTDRKAHSPRWSPDGRNLAFVARESDLDQIFLAPLDGGDARQLTAEPHGATQPAWSPDGKRVAYVGRTGEWTPPKERTPTERNAPRVITTLAHKLDGIGFFDDRRAHVFTLDVESGERTQLTDGDWNDNQPAWSPDGERIAFVSARHADRWTRPGVVDVWAVPAAGGRVRKLTRTKGGAALPAFSPDGKNLAYVGHEHGDAGFAKNVHLMVVPADGGGAPRSVSARLDRAVVGLAAAFGRAFAWTPDSRSLLFLAADRGMQSLFRVGLRGGKPEAVLTGDRQVLAFDTDGRRLTWMELWLDLPPEVHAGGMDGSRSRNVSKANEAYVAEVDLRPVERMAHEAADGTEIETLMVRPAKAGKAPLVLNIHGGPHSMHPYPYLGFALEVQVLAGAGYVVALPNPRGSSGYGEDFTLGCVRDWGGADFDDLMGAVDTLVANGLADRRRLYAQGISYGGFMTTWIVGHTSRFKSAVVVAPVADLVSMFGTTDIPLFEDYEVGGLPWERFDEYQKRSPLTYLEDAKTPVLLVHNEGDLRCPIGQSEQIFQTLAVLGREVEFVRYPGGSHVSGLATPNSQTADRIRRTLDWYAAHR